MSRNGTIKILTTDELHATDNYCGAYGAAAPAKDIYDRYNVVNTLTELKPHWNVHPWEEHEVIVRHSPKQITRMFWNLIPRQSRERDQFKKYTTFNAKKEKLATSPFYAKPFRENQRCLIPATHFFEPDKVNFSKGPFPWYYFGLKSKEIFSFAGVYEVWKDPKTGKDVYSYTMVTVEPNELVGQVHPRMPAMLSREAEEAWIDPDLTDLQQVLDLLQPYPAEEMEFWRAPDAAKSAANDKPDVITPYNPPEQGSFLELKL